jgi:GNAT superfamily N-acetyltransferase
VEVCPFAHPSLVKGLADRRFVLWGFETVFFRGVEGPVAPANPLGAGIRVSLVDVQEDGPVWEYAAAVARGFVDAEHEPRAEDVALWVRCLRQPAVRAFAAWADGRIVGGGAMEVPMEAGGAAALFGLSVLPQYRRRGVQQALIAARLDAARGAGAVVATIGSRPGVATERNARRLGFEVGYTRAILVRPAPGLIPNRG